MEQSDSRSPPERRWAYRTIVWLAGVWTFASKSHHAVGGSFIPGLQQECRGLLNRGRERRLVSPPPPSEPDWRISRIRLSSWWFYLVEGCRASTMADSSVINPCSSKYAFGQRRWSRIVFACPRCRFRFRRIVRSRLRIHPPSGLKVVL